MTNAVIKAGTIEHMRWCYNSKAELLGGTISEDLLVDGSKMSIKGGTINKITCMRKGTLIMTSGTVAEEGMDVSNSRLELKGGTLQSIDREGIKLSNESRAVISGGRIQTSKNGARGISIDGASALTLKGGIIKSTAPKSISAGIYASGSKAKVALKGTKNSPAYVKGYKCGLYKKGSAAFSISKNTKVLALKVRKSGYTRGQKLPKSMKGNLSVTYKKL